MHVFVTGATGHIGSAVVAELIDAGHEVTALVRSDESAAAAAERSGARPLRGSLADLDLLSDAARDADGVIHLAFRHDAMRSGDFAGAVDTDFAAVQALGEALVGTGKPFVGTSGILTVAGQGRTGTEEDAKDAGPRVDAENYIIGLADRGVRSSVVRLSPITHDPGRDHHGFAVTLIDTARRTGVAGYIDDGQNRWPAATTLDSARLYRLAIEQAPSGSRLHAVAEQGVHTKAIAQAIGEHLGVPVVSIPREDAGKHFGFLADFAQIDAPASSERTRELLGWRPTGADLLVDLRDDRYYRN